MYGIIPSSDAALPTPNPVLGNAATSCASGKLSVLAAPPIVAAQLFPAKLLPAAVVQYTVFDALNVMPLLPRKSPMRVPLKVPPAPVTRISRKSTSLTEPIAAICISRINPYVDERIQSLRLPAVLLVENVPAITKPLLTTNSVTPIAVSGVNVRLAQVELSVTVTM